MTQDTNNPGSRARDGVVADAPASRDDPRKARLAEQLRSNLQRRKAQTRARRSGEADGRPDGLGEAADAATATSPGEAAR